MTENILTWMLNYKPNKHEFSWLLDYLISSDKKFGSMIASILFTVRNWSLWPFLSIADLGCAVVLVVDGLSCALCTGQLLLTCSLSKNMGMGS